MTETVLGGVRLYSVMCYIVCLYAAVILMEGGTEFDLKSLDVEDESSKNPSAAASDKPQDR